MEFSLLERNLFDIEVRWDFLKWTACFEFTELDHLQVVVLRNNLASNSIEYSCLTSNALSQCHIYALNQTLALWIVDLKHQSDCLISKVQWLGYSGVDMDTTITLCSSHAAQHLTEARSACKLMSEVPIDVLDLLWSATEVVVQVEVKVHVIFVNSLLKRFAIFLVFSLRMMPEHRF